MKFLRSLQHFFDELGELCRSGASDFYGCIERLSCRELYFIEGIISEYRQGENFRVLWERAVTDNCPFYVDGRTRQLLLSFADVPGKSSGEEFFRKCADFSRLAERAALSEEKKRDSNQRLPVYAGVLTAAALFFIFI